MSLQVRLRKCFSTKPVVLQIPVVLLGWFDKRTKVLLYYVDVDATISQNSYWLCTVALYQKTHSTAKLSMCTLYVYITLLEEIRLPSILALHQTSLGILDFGLHVQLASSFL